MSNSVDRATARQIIRALRSGATPSQFAELVFVGQDAWFQMAQKMMNENAEDHQFEVRFIRAAYGGGKTLLMRRLEASARDSGWATAYILLRHGKVELDKPSTLVAELAEQLDLAADGRGMFALLRTALTRKAKECGIFPGRASTLAAHTELELKIRDICARKSIRHDISIVMRQATKAYVRNDLDRLSEIARWLSGGDRAVTIPPTSAGGRAEVMRPLGAGASEELIRLIAELVMMAGKRGLYIALDEVELIASLAERRRANAFQTLRALVDQNDMNTLPPATSMFLAATPHMFEDRKMFPSYKALQDRIESLPGVEGKLVVNYKANVIDLDATQLGLKELIDLGDKILEFWKAAGEEPIANGSKRIKDIASAVATRTDFTVARPRLFCRLVVDMLEGTLTADLAALASRRALEIKQARDKELVEQ
jgi:hypothetical protein